MRNIKMIVAYDGTRFLGWQKTKMGSSIEETIEDALQKVLRDTPSLQAASRTDAGVHAEGQVINFFTEKEVDLYRLKRGLNAVLPKDISIKEMSEAPLDFHPTMDNIGKEYHYHLCNSPSQLPFDRNYSWHFSAPLCLESMQQASQKLIGTHDFSAFCNEKSLCLKDPICTLYRIEIEELEDKRLRFIIIGSRFLYKMVRNIVGTLVYIGCGKLSPSSIVPILKTQDRTLAGITAPALGLTLHKVLY